MNCRTALLVFGILLLPTLVLAAPQVAVLETVVAPGMDKTAAGPITDKIIEELVNSGKYTVIDRANTDQVLREKEFQLSSGVVSNEEVRQAGEYLGADLVAVASASRVGSTYVISAKMIDVVTGQIVAQASSEQRGTIDVVLDVARTVGRQISGQRVVTAEGRAQELVREQDRKPAREQAPAAPAAPAPAAPAPATASDPAAIMHMQSLISSRAHMRRSGRLQMMSLADEISVSERMTLYATNRKDNAVVTMLLNLLLPSLGSWIQGDVSGGLVGAAWLSIAVVSVSTAEATSYYTWDSQRELFATMGGIAFAVAYVYGAVRPFNYQRQWNANLASGLKTITLSLLDPEQTSFDVYRGQSGLEWKVGLSLVSFAY